MILNPVLVLCLFCLIVWMIVAEKNKRGKNQRHKDLTSEKKYKEPPGLLKYALLLPWKFFGKNGGISTVLRFVGGINSVIRLKFSMYNFVVINDFALGKQAFNKSVFSGKSTQDTWCYPTQGTHGIMNSHGKKWEEQRRFCIRQLKNFGFGTKSMETLIQREIHDFVEDIEKDMGTLISPNKKFYLPILNSIWMILAGERSSNEDGALFQMTLRIYHAFLRAIQFPELAVVASTIKVKTIRKIVTWFPLVKLVFPGLVLFHEAIEELRNYCKELISNRQESLKQTRSDYPRDLLDIYLNEIQSTTDENSEFFKLKGETNLLSIMIDFFLAGGDTTSTMLQWMLLHLIRNPDIQKRIQNEIDSVVGLDRIPSLDDRPSCPYTTAFMEEVLRFSPVSMLSLPHETLEDTNVVEYFIPKGTTVFVNIEYIHRDPKIWSDPDNFRPERFLSPDGSSFVKNEAMVAFSIGRRRCLGEQLARDNMFLFISSICQRFTLKRDPKLQGPPGLVSELSGVNAPKKFYMIAYDRWGNSCDRDLLDCNQNIISIPSVNKCNDSVYTSPTLQKSKFRNESEYKSHYRRSG